MKDSIRRSSKQGVVDAAISETGSHTLGGKDPSSEADVQQIKARRPRPEILRVPLAERYRVSAPRASGGGGSRTLSGYVLCQRRHIHAVFTLRWCSRSPGASNQNVHLPAKGADQASSRGRHPSDICRRLPCPITVIACALTETGWGPCSVPGV